MPTKVKISIPSESTVGVAEVLVSQSPPPAPIRNDHAAYHAEADWCKDHGFKTGSVVVLKAAPLPRHELFQAENWGLITRQYRYLPQGEEIFKPVRVRWVKDGRESNHKAHELVLLVTAPDINELISHINKECSLFNGRAP